MLAFDTASLEALGLCAIAQTDTGRVAGFLLAWHNAEENGGWGPTDLWNVDPAIADDVLTVLQFARTSRHYPGDLGFEPEVQGIWRRWRGAPSVRKEEETHGPLP